MGMSDLRDLLRLLLRAVIFIVLILVVVYALDVIITVTKLVIGV